MLSMLASHTVEDREILERIEAKVDALVKHTQRLDRALSLIPSIGVWGRVKAALREGGSDGRSETTG